MTPTGGTLIQVHYHNRPGGVATVMRRYADAFTRAHRGVGSRVSLMVCHATAGTADPAFAGSIVDVKDCGYRSFRSRARFLAVQKRILGSLASIIDDRALPRPIVIIGHNMNLGKNCALSSAFAALARRCAAPGLMSGRDDIRFFSVVHDFAEEGRTDLLRGIQTVLGLGIDIGDDLYPVLPNLCFSAPHARNYYLLKDAGFPVILVRNPLVKTAAGEGRVKARAKARGNNLAGRLRAELRKIAQRESIRLDPSRPVVLYPSRIISRKNPVEAVLVAHVMMQSTLLLGAVGASVHGANASLAARLKTLCRKYGIPVVFDAGRIADRIVPGIEPFSLLYGLADLCMTTSIAEGFGYSIHEPALYGKTVVGRFPDGFPASEKKNFPHLYKRLFIPAAWVRTGILKRRYYTMLKTLPGWNRNMPSPGAFSRMFDTAFTEGNGIDFACLDVSSQLAVLRRCVRFPAAAREWKKAFPAQTRRLTASARVDGTTPPAAVPAGTAGAFEKSFAQCYFSNRRPVTPSRRPDRDALLRHFCRLEHFRLLMTPQRIDNTASCTVFA